MRWAGTMVRAARPAPALTRPRPRRSSSCPAGTRTPSSATPRTARRGRSRCASPTARPSTSASARTTSASSSSPTPRRPRTTAPSRPMPREAGSPLGRLRVRVRVTLAFAGVMAVVLLATGLFVYLRLAADLDATIDQGLRSRASDVAALVARSGGTLAAPRRPQLVESGEDLAQVLDESGRVVGGTRDFGRAPLLGSAERRRAARAAFTVERDALGPDGDPARLLAAPVRARGRRLVVVAGGLPRRPP